MTKLNRIQPRLKVVNTNIARPLTQAEGYRLRGRKLQTRNARILTRDALCKVCLSKTPPQISESREVDHVIPLHLGGHDGDDNLQGLCIPCHEAKSEQEAQDRANGTAQHRPLAMGDGRGWGVI